MYADPEKYLGEPENRFHVVKYLPEKFIYNFSNKTNKDALLGKDVTPQTQILNQDGTGWCKKLY